jgi:hypothetical protein
MLMPRPLVAALAAALLALPALRAEDLLPFRDPDLPLARRVDDLISRLTVDEKIAQTMMGAAEVQRLGIPRYDWWNEALHGVARNGVATVFPQAIGLAATWNPELHQRVAETIATEARAKNNEATPSATKASPSGRPTSTSSATRAGVAARRPTARIPSSPPASGSPSCAACRATTHVTSRPSPP